MHGYQISKITAITTDELLRSRYQTLVDTVRLGDEDFDYSETMIEILGQIVIRFCTNKNDKRNWFKLNIIL